MRKLFLLAITLISILLFSNLAKAQEILLDGFEDVEARDVEYCYKNLVGACTSGTRSYTRVKNWFPFTDLNYSRVKDFGKSLTDFKTQGLYSFALWWIPPAECSPTGYTLDNPWHVTCGNTTTGEGGFMYRNFTLNDTNYILKFDIAPCNFYPVKCVGWYCYDEYYGITDVNGTPIKIDVYLKIAIYENGVEKWKLEGLLDSALPEDASFKTTEVDLRPILSSGNFTLYFEIKPPSNDWQYPVCAVIDNIRAEKIVIPPSPIATYVSDMLNFTFTEMPYIYIATGTGCEEYYKLKLFQSRYYDNVSLFMMDLDVYNDNCNYIPKVWAIYKNGSEVEITEYVDWTSGTSTYPYGWRRMYYFPLDTSKIKGARFQFYSGGTVGWRVNITFDTSYPLTRNKYPTNLTGVYESAIGKPYPYDILVYNFSLTHDLNLTFSIAGLSKGYSPRFDFFLKSSDGTVKAYSRKTYTTPSYNVSLHYNDFLKVLGVSLESGDYIQVDYLGTRWMSNTTSYFYPEKVYPAIVCRSECVDTTYYMRRLIGGTCVTTIIPDYPLCVAPPPPPPPEIPPEETQPVTFINTTYFEQVGLGFLLPFLTPLAFTMYIIIGISAGVEYALTKEGASPRGLAFGITFIALVLAATYLGKLPVWIGWLLIILSAGVMAFFMRKLIGGG